MVIIVLSLLLAAVIANPMPVLPLVDSMIVSPSLIYPVFIPSKIILLPILSFTDPPGFIYSHLDTIKMKVTLLNLTYFTFDSILLRNIIKPY